MFWATSLLKDCTGVTKDVSVAGAACFATTKEDNSVVSRFALHSSLRQVGRAFSLIFTWGYLHPNEQRTLVGDPVRPRLVYVAPSAL